jgi:hypothetical protein
MWQHDAAAIYRSVLVPHRSMEGKKMLLTSNGKAVGMLVIIHAMN